MVRRLSYQNCAVISCPHTALNTLASMTTLQQTPPPEHTEPPASETHRFDGDVEGLLKNDLQMTPLLEDEICEDGEEDALVLKEMENLDDPTNAEDRMPTVTTVLLLLVWLGISCGLVVSNKYIMHTLGFSYPATLTCWHQATAAIITQIFALRTTGHSALDGPQITRKDYVSIIVPVAALFSLSLVCNNMPYLSLSVAFIQMLKGLGPATTLIAMWSLGLQSLDAVIYISIGLIVTGTLISSIGEVKFAVGGFFYQILGLIFDGYRLGLTRKLLSGDKKIEPLRAMHYMAPPSALMLGLIAAVTEWPALKWEDANNVGMAMFLINAGMAFLLNLVIFRLVSSCRATVCCVINRYLSAWPNQTSYTPALW